MAALREDLVKLLLDCISETVRLRSHRKHASDAIDDLCELLEPVLQDSLSSLWQGTPIIGRPTRVAIETPNIRLDCKATFTACRDKLVTVNGRLHAIDESVQRDRAARWPNPDPTGDNPGTDRDLELEKQRSRRLLQNRAAQSRFITIATLRDLEAFVKGEVLTAYRKLQSSLEITQTSELNRDDSEIITTIGRGFTWSTFLSIPWGLCAAFGPLSSPVFALPVVVALYLRSITACAWFVVSFCSVVLIGTALSLWWSLWKGDISGGFTLGAFVTGTGCAVVNKLHSRHREDGRCQCNRQSPETGVEMGAPEPDGVVPEESVVAPSD